MKSISVKNAVFICILGLVAVLLSLYGCGEGGGEANGDDENTPTTNPDLVVESPSVSDNTPTAGGNFTLSATVRNDGGGASGVTTLRYYRSTDGTITTSDTAVGTDAVTGLSTSGSASESVDLTAPSSPGTYYYGACVDAVTDESDTTNNCSESVQVNVSASPQQSQGSPDLVVYAVLLSSGPFDTDPEAPFTLSAAVRNDGDGDSAATTLRYYRSTDATITTSDMEVGTYAVAGLSASGSVSESVDLTTPSGSGTYYYGACVDAVTDESDTNNNCSASVQVTVSEPQDQPQGLPDLTISTVAVATNPSGTYPGGSFTLSATVRNDGDGASGVTTLRYYRSTDGTITTSDIEVGSYAVAELSTSGSASESVDLTAPSSPGTYYYGACVDTVTGESDTNNNCSASVQVDVASPSISQPPPPQQPDLAVVAFFLASGVHDGAPGRSLTFQGRIRNVGNVVSPATTLRFYRSRNRTIATDDTFLDTVAVGTIAASRRIDSETLTLTAPSAAGTYYYGACVDAVTDESDTTNNCSDARPITVDGPPPDLVVTGPSVSEIREDGTFWLIVTVSNQGAGGAAATTVRYKRSTDGTITTSATTVGTDAVNTLFPAGGSGATIKLTAPSTPGTYYYGGCVDAVPRESDTTNNCSSAASLVVN